MTESFKVKIKYEPITYILWPKVLVQGDTLTVEDFKKGCGEVLENNEWDW